ncbi:MAG: alpha/beta hydrolase-fold protein [Candidatus Promineifilaceae bacterium]|nr:alpha/beta hydrolase-fold protein [Candidatus Promineifilaceae bacterium]
MAVLILTLVLGGALLLLAWWAKRRQTRRLATVATEELAIWSAELGRAVRVQVFLPPGYAADGQRHYPVLYLNDGQDAARLGLRETLVRQVARGRLTPLIVVAVFSDQQRLHEYGTAVAPNAQGLGGRAAAYSRFLVEVLLPLIDGRYRTRSDLEERGLLGMSLGGLAAFEIAWRHPERFGVVGVMSGSFWWRAGDELEAGSDVGARRRITHEMVRRSRGRQPGRPRIWLQAGTRDERADRDNNGVIDAIQDTLELMDELAALGYNKGVEMVYVEALGGRHRPSTWADMLPRFLTWAFPGPRQA